MPADIWLHKAISNRLHKKEICLTFDDALKCQIDIALPILQQFGITAFWFVYSSVFKGKTEKLEINRYFYNVRFPKFTDFYEIFRKYLDKSEYAQSVNQGIADRDISKYLDEFSFYSEAEREFRYIRDQLMTREQYQKVMDDIMRDFDFNIDKAAQSLWMKENNLICLTANNHKIGMHSYSHPTHMAGLNIQRQQIEYTKNKEHIMSVTQVEPETVSHPCGSYNQHTLKILRDLKIKVGFRSNFHKIDHGNLEFPRVDHTHLLKECNVKSN